jgi:anti-anti-sigma regulatory factor
MKSGQVLGYPSHLMEPVHLDLQKLGESNGDQVVMGLEGKLTLETVHNFIQTLRPEPAAKLVLDLAGVSFLDSAGVERLCNCLCTAGTRGKLLR